MKITIKFNTSNDAFYPDKKDEIEGIMRYVTEKVSECVGNGLKNAEFTLKDASGNTVGRAKMKDESDD